MSACASFSQIKDLKWEENMRLEVWETVSQKKKNYHVHFILKVICFKLI